jgi:hypothetical protein
MTPEQQEALTTLAKGVTVGWRGREEERTEALAAMAVFEQAIADLDTLLPIGRMYLDALDDDPANEMLTLPEAIGVTAVREAVRRGEGGCRFKSAHTCRVCGRWLEGEWSGADAAGRVEIQRQMDAGHCDTCHERVCK